MGFWGAGLRRRCLNWHFLRNLAVTLNSVSSPLRHLSLVFAFFFIFVVASPLQTLSRFTFLSFLPSVLRFAVSYHADQLWSRASLLTFSLSRVFTSWCGRFFFFCVTDSDRCYAYASSASRRISRLEFLSSQAPTCAALAFDCRKSSRVTLHHPTFLFFPSLF